jgi:Secretion system C-terminal sorting domain
MRILLSVCMLATILCDAQCDPSETQLDMNIYTDSWGYETYWELVPGENSCGDQTIAWGSNSENVGCDGGGQQDAGNTESAYPNNSIVTANPICLVTGQPYSLYFVDDWGDGGLTFELFQDGSLFGFFQGVGANATWTFEAGANPLGSHDSPCNALEIIPQLGNAVELDNTNCVAQINEVTPFLGHCMADGAWCYDATQHSVWAKFNVPDEGSYEISTVHMGTNINTQIAVWYTDDCSNPENFVLLSSNDDYWGDPNISACSAMPPPCVNQSSAAYLNVIQTMPTCCTNGWDDACQQAYDLMHTSCTNELPCFYTLRGIDSYGDGWNNCSVEVQINSSSDVYTFSDGLSFDWNLPITEGDEISLSFIAGQWPEEVSIELLNALGQVLFEGPLLGLESNFYSTIATCSTITTPHANASRCYVHCSPPGMTCYIQIDGYNDETGPIILSVQPYELTPQILTQSSDLLCPVAIGIPSEAYIVTHLDGWGLNHSTHWTGPNDYSAEDIHISELNPGDYTVVFENDCGQSMASTITIHGPSAFVIQSESLPSCPNQTNGSINAQVTGATPPYNFEWLTQVNPWDELPNTSALFPGEYYLHVADANGCTILTGITVDSLPSPEFSLGDDLEVCQHFAIQLEGPLNMDSYSWSTLSSIPSIELFGQDFESGTYPISLEVTNACGCSYSDEMQLTVLECVNVEEKSSNFVVFPNPTSEKIHLPTDVISYRLFDTQGQLIQQSLSRTINSPIEVTDITSGLYFLQLFTNTSSSSHSIVVQH